MYVYKSKPTKELPAVTIGDNSVENSGWTWQDGWQGLVPCQSTLADAQAVLGEITGLNELANGITYDFRSGLIRVTILDGQDSIVKIWIDSQAPQPFKPPSNISEAQRSYGKLVATAVNRNEGAIFERPGMRICCDAMQESNPLRWIDIYKPQED